MIPHPAALGALFAREGKSGAEVSFSYRERTEDSSRELRLQTVRSLSSLHPGRKRGEGGGTKRDGAVDTEGRRRTAHTTVEAQGVVVGAHGASSESDARWPQCCAPTT